MKYLYKYINKKDLPYAIIAILLGCLNHFLYQLSKGAAIAALFCPVNESTWEHLKLLFFPFLFVSVCQYIRCRPQALRFFYYRFLAVFCGMLSIIALFYTYTGVIGQDFVVIDILIFVFSILFSFFMSSFFERKKWAIPSQTVVFSLWILVSICFFTFTCYPPGIPLFFSPL